MTVAPPILAGAPGSFARGVFHDRHPKLIEQVLAAHPYNAAAAAALRELLAESTAGVLEPLVTTAEGAAHWSAWGAGLWGRPWAEVPFLWAESYFYRRLLEAVGYFGPGPWRGIDPFAPTKAAELAGPAVADELAALDGLVDIPLDKRRSALLLSALWGNQADLSFQLTAGANARATRLLVDDGDALWSRLSRTTDPLVCVIADNAGRELLPDLILIDHLLTTAAVARVTLHVKPRPYYVSDATMTDVLAALRVLRTADTTAARAVGQRLWAAVREDRLVVRDHEFFCAPLPFHEMPADLATEFAGAAITVVKGDLNYRRLVGDRHWPPTTPFADLVDYFPTPVLALRTLKSDVAVGLTDDQVRALDATGTPWRTSGEHALIQASVSA
ncbi:damage-control phosphatase ARMT1 family protein [Nocardia sp. CDC159]|uniref:Damage-control phosphatase ARMT1 family protein n=1 Tax=Nocardia pulmonis TaxID=2951408 RepID=A0A9X2EA06_9NOCA|nr:MULTISPECIES: damage-control phosphatase ARMT1 family protein [Nocardia]MCM6775578.1 damage-control phosphatase ARMT1 family protein [Nocardia pulmonis]MCM6787688.1 damage-control phosphatase ARMT1 family protein [Nocardia sp. CDC159]